MKIFLSLIVLGALLIPGAAMADVSGDIILKYHAGNDDHLWQELINQSHPSVLTQPSGNTPYVLGQFDFGESSFSDNVVKTCSVPPQIPEPTTMLLFGAGLFGFGVIRARRR